MSDILADYREWRSKQKERIGTHSDRCHLWPSHERCMIHRMATEVERLRLTDAERETIEWAVRAMRPECRTVLQGLLERTK